MCLCFRSFIFLKFAFRCHIFFFIIFIHFPHILYSIRKLFLELTYSKCTSKYSTKFTAQTPGAYKYDTQGSKGKSSFCHFWTALALATTVQKLLELARIWWDPDMHQLKIPSMVVVSESTVAMEQHPKLPLSHYSYLW